MKTLTTINLEYLGISDLTGIEAFTGITVLNCRHNELLSVNVSANTALTLLWVKRNKLTSLDVSANTALTNLLCQDNQLTSLNLKNGNNTILAHLNAHDNSGLLCIQVDDTAYANANWSYKKDNTANFRENCYYTAVDEATAISDFGIIPNPGNGKFWFRSNGLYPVKIKIYGITGEIVYEAEIFDSEIDLSAHSKGIYFVVMNTGEGNISRKLIIQ